MAYQKIISNAAFMAAFIFSCTISKAVELEKIIPVNNEITGWKISDSARIFKGNELYNYIDGGAEIFMEYGFAQIITTSYKDEKERLLQVEVYEMEDTDAAYGAYTFYLNNQGESLLAGQESAFIDYYGIAWKGKLLVVVSTPGGDTTLKYDIGEFARNMMSKYAETDSKSKLFKILENISPINGPVKYLEGKVGLSNVYKFVPGNAFSFEKAITFQISNQRIILFQLNSEQESKDCMQNALERIQKANKETKFEIKDSAFTYTDYRNNIVHGVIQSKYLLLVIGKEQKEINKITEEIEKRLR